MAHTACNDTLWCLLLRVNFQVPGIIISNQDSQCLLVNLLVNARLLSVHGADWCRFHIRLANRKKFRRIRTLDHRNFQIEGTYCNCQYEYESQDNLGR